MSDCADGGEKPLKFSARPVETVLVAGSSNTLGATVRYEDERGIEEGDELGLQRSGSGSAFGTASVEHVEKVPASRALDVIEMHCAEYGVQTLNDLIRSLNCHYDDAICPSTEVKVIILDPDICWGELVWAVGVVSGTSASVVTTRGDCGQLPLPGTSSRQKLSVLSVGMW